MPEIGVVARFKAIRTPRREPPVHERILTAAALAAGAAPATARRRPPHLDRRATTASSAPPPGPARLRQARGAKIELALIRLPATDPAHRIGTLFTNPGGPGNSGVAFVRDEARDVYSAAVAPASTSSASTRAASALHAGPLRRAPQPPFPVGAEQERAFAAAAADLGRRCRAATATCSTTSRPPTSRVTSTSCAPPSATPS